MTGAPHACRSQPAEMDFSWSDAAADSGARKAAEVKICSQPAAFRSFGQTTSACRQNGFF